MSVAGSYTSPCLPADVLSCRNPCPEASYAPEVTRMTQTLLQTLQKEALSNAGGQVNFTESPGGSVSGVSTLESR